MLYRLQRLHVSTLRCFHLENIPNHLMIHETIGNFVSKIRDHFAAYGSIESFVIDVQNHLMI